MGETNEKYFFYFCKNQFYVKIHHQMKHRWNSTLLISSLMQSIHHCSHALIIFSIVSIIFSFPKIITSMGVVITIFFSLVLSSKERQFRIEQREADGSVKGRKLINSFNSTVIYQIVLLQVNMVTSITMVRCI